MVLTAAVAKLFADDPIDCSTLVTATPGKFFVTFSTLPAETDTITRLSNNIARRSTRALSYARAATTNANRASCPDFSAVQKAVLFSAAQYQASEIGRFVARMGGRLWLSSPGN